MKCQIHDIIMQSRQYNFDFNQLLVNNQTWKLSLPIVCMKASSSSCGLKSGMKLSRSGEAGGLWGLCGARGGLLGPPKEDCSRFGLLGPPNEGCSRFGLFGLPKEGCSRFGLFGPPKEGCSRFGLGLVGFPKSTKEPTGGDGRVGCLGGMAWF